jgi:sec-independent protein translocase protein TatB
MFGDIGWSELLLIGIVALIVIGPEDLPQMFRQLGRFTAKMRSMSRDFSRAMDQAAKESGVKDVTDTVKGASSATSVGLSKVKAAADRFEKWDPIKSSTKSSTASPLVPPAMPETPSSTPAPVLSEATIHGAETLALLQKQAAKKAVLLQTAEKLKAIRDGTDGAVIEKLATALPAAKAKTTPKSRVDTVLAKPRAAKKPKKADEA